MSRPKLLLLWLVCVAAGLLSALWMLLAVIAGSKRAWAIALGYDQLGNATFGGSEDELISSRCWRYRADPAYARWVAVINWLAGDPHHCQDSYEAEQARVATSCPTPD